MQNDVMAMQVKTRGRVVSGIRRAPSNADMHGQGVVMRVREFFRALLAPVFRDLAAADRKGAAVGVELDAIEACGRVEG